MEHLFVFLIPAVAGINAYYGNWGVVVFMSLVYLYVIKNHR